MNVPRVIGLLVLVGVLATTGAATSYEVKEGDTLFLIARRELGDGNRWSEIAAANGIGEPWTIRVGQRLDLPTGTRSVSVPEPDAGAPARTATRDAVVPTPPPPSPTREDAPAPLPAATDAAPLLDPAGIAATLPPAEPWTIADARSRAARRNLSLRAEALSPRTAATELQAARAGFDPTLTASIDRSWSRTQTHALPSSRSELTTTSAEVGVAQTLPPGTRYAVSAQHARSRTATTTSGGTPTHTADVGVSVTQPLLEGAGRAAAYAGVDAAAAGLEAARARALRREAVTAAEIDAAYWALAEAEESERIAEESWRRASTLLERNLALLREGLIAEVEVLTAKDGLAARREAWIAAVLERAGRAETLLFLADGADAPARTVLPSAASEPPLPQLPPDAATLEARALRDRPDLAAAAADARAASIRERRAQNALLPNLDVTASAGTGGRAGRFGSAWDGVSDNDEPSWSVGAALTVPLGNRADRADAEAAAIEIERRRLAVASLSNEIRLEVRDAHRAVSLGIARLEAALESERTSRARWTAETRRLELGLGDTLRVLEAEQAAASAALGAARARFAVASAWSRLEAAIPGLAAPSPRTEPSPQP